MPGYRVRYCREKGILEQVSTLPQSLVLLFLD